LIITEDGKTYPLLKCYPKNYSFKDLNITRWTKLKYKVVRNRNFLKEKDIATKIERDFFKVENPSKVKEYIKDGVKMLMKNLDIKKPSVMWMAGGETVNF
jgi:hypothetical protein